MALHRDLVMPLNYVKVKFSLIFRLDVPTPTSGHTTSRDEFNKGYIGSLLNNKQNVLAFVQDQVD